MRNRNHYLLALICAMLLTAPIFVACDLADEPVAATVTASVTATPATGKPTDLTDRLTLTDAAAVYAAPDAYVGRAFDNVFQVYSASTDAKGVPAYYAVGLVRDSSQNGFTLLRFINDTPTFYERETVYLYGTVSGKGVLEGNDGTVAELLMLTVSSYERSVPESGLFTRAGTWKPAPGSAAVVCGTLSTEVASVEFEEDGTVLTTKTVDTGVTAQTTYYMDVFVHQNGYYAWYPACNYWIMPDGLPGYDIVPFPALDADSPMTVQLAPFDEKGQPVSQMLQIEVSPS